MESIRDCLLNLQAGIITAARCVARMADGVHKQEAQEALQSFRKSDKTMRDRLWILQVWRKHGQEVATQLSCVKTGELLDQDLAKILKDKQKNELKIQRDLAKERAVTQQQAKRFKAEPGAGSSGYNRGVSSRGVSSRGGRGNARGGGGPGRGGGPEPGQSGRERRCYTCQSIEHFARNCPKNK